MTAAAAPRSWRLAGAPITWGVCEVPGWGRMLASDRVLAEMASVGLRATELGAPGFLPEDPDALRAVLGAHDMHLVGAFVPLVLHEERADAARAEAERVAASLAALGAGIFVAAIVLDPEWSAPRPLEDAEWRRLVDHLAAIDELVAGHGLVLAVHPHVGTLIERAPEVERLLRDSDAGWCLDTGHLLIGGVDPVAFARDHADRVVHVHLKDVDAALAARVREGELSLMAATQAGLFRPLGRGDVPVDAVMAELDRAGFVGWVVLEQDTAITGDEPAPGAGPVLDARASLEYLAAIGEPGR